MKFSLVKEQDSTFSFILSILIHAFIFVFIATNINVFESLFKYDVLEESVIDKNDEYVFLIDTPDIEEEENEDSIFVSDKSLKQTGLDDAIPDVFITDQSTLSAMESKDFFDILNNSQKKQNNKNITDDQYILDEAFEKKKKEGSLSRASEPKIPSTFNEGISRAIVISSETGVLQLGTKAEEYYWYFKSLVDSIQNSWSKTIPNQAHYLGLIRSDDVEVLISIDENGGIAFEKFLEKSKTNQISLDSSCEKAIEHASKINPPPEGLLRDYAENGKIYIPFKFVYRNFNN